MADDKQVKSRREQHIERMRKKYPEKAFADEEEIYGTISDDYDQYEQENKSLREENETYKGREKALSDMFAADPKSAQFLADMHKGNSPVLGLLRNFGPQIKDILDDPDMQEEIAKAEAEYVQRVAKNKELEELYSSNFKESMGALSAFQEETGITDEVVDQIGEFLVTIINDGVVGKFTKETFQMALNAINHDADVAMASEEGEIAGRNAKIEEKLRKPQRGDGTNPIGGSNNTPAPVNKRQSIFDLASEAS